MIKNSFNKNKKLFFILLVFFILTCSFKNFNLINKNVSISKVTKVNAHIIPINSTAKNSLPKEVFLTFDDGPIPVITEALLDILKQHNVKATFFIVGKEIPGREDILKRIYLEGHSIGLHSYSHNFNKIYSTDDALIDEMLKTQEKIKEITGFTSNIVRFPGGSSKRLSKNLLEKLHANNLKIYDWNLSLEDGINGMQRVDKLVRTSQKYNENWSKIILLMHCNSNNKPTVLALPTIIENYKNLGYAIKPITKGTEEYVFKIRK